MNINSPSYIVNKESLQFLFDHDLLSKNYYDNLFELQIELDELLSFINFNVSDSEFNNEITTRYNSMLFPVIEYHIYNTIQKIW